MSLVATILTSLFLSFTPADVGCDIHVISSSSSNPKPIKWMHSALRQQGICGTLISTTTNSTGQKDRYHKRGRRETIVVIPEGLELARSSDIIYWFHGLTGFKPKTFKKRLGPQYGWLVREQSWPAVLVVTEMPWSYFTRTQWKRQGKVFRKTDAFYNYTREIESLVVSRLKTDSSFYFNRIIIGHSAGGSAIASAAKYGGLCRSRPVGVVFSDSTYGNWFEKAWNGCLSAYSKNSKVRIMVLGQSFGSPWKNYMRWSKRRKKSRKRVEAYRLPVPWTHGRIGNNAIPFFYHRFLDGKYKDIYEGR